MGAGSAFRLSLLALVLCTSGFAAEAEEAAETKTKAGPAARRENALLVSWDGVRRDVLKEMLKAGKLPNLGKVIKAGSMQDIVVEGHRTETRPSHATMLSGLSAKLTGISSNSSRGGVPAGYTLFDRLKKALGEKNVATIAVTGKAYVGTLFTASRKNIDTYDAGWYRANRTGTAALAALLKHGKEKRRFFAFVHFADPDSAGHGRGEGSADYLKAIETCDAWLGLFVAQLKKHKLEGKTNIYVTSDHGFDKGKHTHHDAPDIWLATSDRRVTKGGSLADVPATILDNFGLDLSKLKPALLGKPLTGAKPKPKKIEKKPAA